jgi:hypothetical protein
MNPRRQGEAWTPTEEKALAEGFADNPSIPDLAARHERTVRAITKRLIKLGLLENEPSKRLVVQSNAPSPAEATDELRRFLDELNASVRLRRALQRCGVSTLEALAQIDDREFLRILNVGRTTLRDYQRIRRELPPTLRVSPQAARAHAVPSEDRTNSSQNPAAIEKLDHLLDSLNDLKGTLVSNPDRVAQSQKIAREAFVRLDDSLVSITSSHAANDGSREDMPLPDRFRAALADLVKNCVPEHKRRYVALRTLGLEDDGVPARLSDIAQDLGISRERVRQLRNKAYARIHGSVRHRIGTCQRLRNVMKAVSAETDWTDPRESTRQVIRLLSDGAPMVRSLALICCLAAGWSGNVSELSNSLTEIAAAECQRTEDQQRWRLDTWKDAAAQAAIPGPVSVFHGPPSHLVGRKREPGEVRDEGMLIFQSAKLGRQVACESGSEYRVVSWLEASADVVWYQEQPVVVPYQLRGRSRRYFPDFAILDRRGAVYIMEVKPISGMYRELTLAKALACFKYVSGHGMGYLLVDRRGRSISDYASNTYNGAVADKIDALIDKHDRIPYSEVRAIFEVELGRVTAGQFISMTINRGWSITDPPGVTIGRLPDGLSFQPLVTSSNLGRA